MESEIRKVHLGQNEDQREQKQFEDKQGPTPPLHAPPIAEQKLIQASRYVNSEGNHLKGQVPRGTADRGFACRPEKVHASAGDIQQLWDLAVWPGMRADA